MPAAFLLFLSRALRAPWWAMLYLVDGSPARLPRRLLLLTLVLPLFLALQVLHWIGFLLDELLFRGYRRVNVHRPVFIVGPPRSGTTLLQRTMARDSGFTTLRGWECLFAPSVTERCVYRALASLLHPLVSLLRRHRPLFVRRLDPMHFLSLAEPEEDVVVLLSIFSCLQLFICLPSDSALRELAFFDRDVPPRRRRVILDFYFRCVQKHLYFHGSRARFLAKNPTFSSMIESVAARFPDARFIVCARSPTKVAPSLLSLLDATLDLLGRRMTPEFRDGVLDVLHFYYANLSWSLRRYDPWAPVVYMIDLKQRLPETVALLYRELRLSMTPEYRAELMRRGEAAHQHVSRHQYAPERYGLDPAALAGYFADVWPLGPGDVCSDIA